MTWTSEPPKEPGCRHAIDTLPYLSAHADAIRRMKHGEQQLKCPLCGLWIWQSNFERIEEPEER